MSETLLTSAEKVPDPKPPGGRAVRRDGRGGGGPAQRRGQHCGMGARARPAVCRAWTRDVVGFGGLSCPRARRSRTGHARRGSRRTGGAGGELAPEPARPSTPLDGLADAERRVYEALPARGARTADQVAVAAGLPATQVVGPLASLELAGL